MIYAKTGMQKLPDHCGHCEFHGCLQDRCARRGWVYQCELTYSTTAEDVRMDDCPLVDIDETKEANHASNE